MIIVSPALVTRPRWHPPGPLMNLLMERKNALRHTTFTSLVLDYVCKKDHILLIYQEQRGFSVFLTRDPGSPSQNSRCGVSFRSAICNMRENDYYRSRLKQA
jgi:hypothetical protein